jgi:glycosyltransferase involved in cell wall biosynthesis
MMVIPVTVAAKNEERCLGACLDALLAAVEFAAQRGLRFDLLVVLDDCTDGTEAVARGRGVATRRSSGGKVEAQRAGLRGGPFAVFVDADVLVSPPTLAGLAEVMLARPEVVVAWPPREPLPPVGRGRLARALHTYNRRRGFSSQRTWFNGKCFVMRGWSVPTRAELAERISGLPDDNFYDYAAGMRVDDIYLSRRVVAERGPGALVEVATGCVYYRAPETLRGMYRYYRRMRMEIERTSALFPELEAAHARFGARRADLLINAPLAERIEYCEFQLALMVCRAGYRLERAYYRRFARSRCPAWPPVEETKCSLVTETRG